MTMTPAAANNPAATLIRTGAAQPMRPWPRYLLSPEAWRALAQVLQSNPDPNPAFLGLWADTAHVHALFMADAPLLASVRVEAGLFDALSPARPAAAPFERMVHDLWGHLAGDGVDPRPLLDQGRWPVLRPLAARPVPNAAPPEPAEFLGAAGHGLYHIDAGPIGGPLDPVHLRVTAAGERVVRLEAALGYAHRGILALMRGKPPHAAAPLAARISGNSTVAHSIAFARAVEAAAAIDPPPRAHGLRGIMTELERIAARLTNPGAATPSAATPSISEARFSDLREGILRASHAAFGHRLLMDCVVPGGTSVDITSNGTSAVSAALDQIDAALPTLRRSSTLRLAKISDSIRLLRTGLAGLPSGAVSVAVTPASGEGLGVADGPHGEIWHWLHLDAGAVAANFACDPSWLQWPWVEVACRRAHLADMPPILRSFSPHIPGLEL